MHPHLTPRTAPSVQHEQPLNVLIWGLSIFTMVLTIPQILTIWVDRQATGVSALSWGAYLIAAFVWFWYGVKKGDMHIYLPCIGWILLDGAVIIGVWLYG
jgi:uncharacterized protein with PQ loop repeat